MVALQVYNPRPECHWFLYGPSSAVPAWVSSPHPAVADRATLPPSLPPRNHPNHPEEFPPSPSCLPPSPIPQLQPSACESPSSSRLDPARHLSSPVGF